MSNLIERAKSFYGLALSDPARACEEYLAADFVLENPLPSYIPFGGTYQGAEGFVKYLTQISETIDMGPLVMAEWAADDHTVVARGEEDSLVKSTGRRYRMRFVHWLSFDESGKITAMREFNDTAEMGKAFDHEAA
jgi:ketosteroid isomerase-like protein